MNHPVDSQSSDNSTAEVKATDAMALEVNETTGKPLFLDGSFWGLMVTQFLGAFNDNLYKQLMLLLALPAAAAASAALAEGQPASTNDDIQGWAGLIFALPFVLFSGFAGFLSDRFKKTPIIVLCKYAEILVMILGTLAFLYYGRLGEFGTWTVLFLMATQSAFFGPGKYGLLPELFRYQDLARANGLLLMSTFLAIIMGIVAGGFLKEHLQTTQLWIGSIICVGIAVLGVLTAHLIRNTPPANPQARLTIDCWGVSREMIGLFRVDRPLLAAIFVSSIFWLVSGLAVPVVNRLGMDQLQLGETYTSILTAGIAFGIMGGALAASVLCRSRFGKYAVNIGMWGMFVTLSLLGMWNQGGHPFGFVGCLILLMITGVFAAVFSIPVQVFLQARPPKALKGRLIATMNQANFLGILLAGPLYQLFEGIARRLGWPISSVFWMMALMLLPLAIFYRLDSRLSTTETMAA